MFRRSMSLVLTIVAVSLCLSVTEPYAEFWPMTGPESLPLVNCRWQDADRTTLLVEGEHYALRVAMNPVKILGLSIDGQEQLGPDGMSIGILDSEGTIYSPDSDSTARWNVWRCGPYYWDAHLLEIPFSDAAGGTVASGEIIFHIHSDRCHIEILVAPEKESLYSAKAVWACDPLRASTARADARPALSLNTCWALGTNGSRFSSDGKAWVAPLRQKDNRVHTYWVLRPGSPDLSPKYLFQEELDPLHKDGVSVADGFWMGYDPAAGFYEVSCDNGMIRGGFESWFKNPSRRLGTAIGIESDRDREMLIKYSSGSAGTLEASVLTDGNGFPYPIVVQACKNFGGEKEEPDDTPFSESYFPVSLKAKETTEFNAVHLFQNWGNHPLTQFSSIRFFTIYWHLSTGVTETTCYPLNPMTASAPGAKRFFSIADYRPMSGVMWPAQPQHHHVALQGFLQYETESGVQNMVYERTITKSIAPNLAHFSMFYHTTDDAAKCAIDAFEIPQLDETRAFVRIRYDFEKPVEIAGDARLNFRILNKGTYIRQIRFPKVTWSDPDNAIRSEDIRYDSQPTLLGEMMGGECPFACMYPHEDGNDSVIVRSYRARLGGTDYEAPALSVTGYESSRENRAICEMTLTVKDEALKIQPGDFVEADLILMPYGDKGSSYHQPNLERTYYGAQAPKVQVSTGEKIADFPTVVRAKGDEASFTLSGGFDYVPITVTGLEGWRAPLLWEGNSWIDQQVHGGDGYQVQPDGEGGYQCTFVYPTRRDQSHGFHVTRAGCSTGIEKMFYDNGDVVIESEQVGEFSLKAPLLFAPGRNRILKDSPIYSFSGRASKIRSAHLSCGPDSDTLVVNVREPRKGTFRVDVEEGSGRLTFRGLPPRTLYKVKAGNDSWDEASSSSGDLAVMMERPGTVVLREHPKQKTIPPVRGLTVSEEQGLRLRWHPNWAPEVTGYAIARRTDYKPWIVIATVLGTQREYFDTDLELGASYEYRVRAVGENDRQSPDSEAVSASAPNRIRVYDFIEQFGKAKVIKPEIAARVQIAHPLVGGKMKAGIFAHPVQEGSVIVRYGVELPEGKKKIVGFTGIRDGATITDGVEFEIQVEGKKVWHEIHDEHRWREFQADISGISGAAVIDFITRKGPDNSSYDWAFWGEPGVVVGE